MFKTVLHANEGSEPAFRALTLSVEIARQNGSVLHLVCVEEIPPMPEYLEEIREAKGTAARRFHAVVERARHVARAGGIEPNVHVLSGHPVRVIVDLASRIGADLIVIGATGHSALYERLIGSRADRIMQLAPRPVLVVK